MESPERRHAPGEPFGHSAACPVRVLGHWAFHPGKIVESALVFALPRHIHDLALTLRAHHPRQAPGEFQLTPHVTLLYMGTLEGSVLEALHHHIVPRVPRQPTDVRLSGFGVFDDGGGSRSWHIRIAPAAPLSAMRAEFSALCGASGWQETRLNYGAAFIPHITLWDKFSGDTPEVDGRALPSDSFALSQLLHIGRPMPGHADA